MNKTVLGVLGFLVLMTGIALPFAHLQQMSGDILPLLVGFFASIVGVCMIVKATRK
jgi:uncharacterized membrane protein HdeD (DUF308 family)